MKKKLMSLMLVVAMGVTALAGCGAAGQNTADNAAGGAGDVASTQAVGQASDGTADQSAADGKVYKVGIVKYVDDASLDQIESAIQAELDAKGAELGVTFDYADYTSNGQADATVLNQIATNLVADQVDVIIPIATPAAMIMQSATEDNQIPVVFSAISDPVGAGLVASLDAPGSNITGTSDALDVDAIMNLIVVANADTKKIGLLYDKGQDSSNAAIAAAIAYCEANGIAYVEKTGTTTAELSAAADALVAEGVDAVFTPQDNTVMTAELAIFEKFQEAKIPHYTGADSFALNGAFLGYGVNYTNLGTATADMVVDILVNGASPAETAVQTLADGIITINTETAEKCGIDAAVFDGNGSQIVTVTTQESF